jgi:hypothetical protein
MVFLKFSQLLESFSVKNKRKMIYFPISQAKFFFNCKVFFIDQFF